MASKRSQRGTILLASALVATTVAACSSSGGGSKSTTSKSSSPGSSSSASSGGGDNKKGGTIYYTNGTRDVEHWDPQRVYIGRDLANESRLFGRTLVQFGTGSGPAP